MIILEGISKAFEGQQILQDVTFNIEEGENLCIIGRSGSGKSVLTKMITGIFPPDAGRIIIDEVDIGTLDQRDWTPILRNFGVVFQGAALFDSLDVFENVGMLLLEEGNLKREEIRELVVECLSMVELEESILTKFPSELSGGMRKRVGIARGIIHRPKYLIYDEPTTGLDPVSSDTTDELIENLAKDPSRTSIIVTHYMRSVKRLANHLVFIHNKTIYFNGKPEAFFASEDPEIKKFLNRVNS